MNAAHRRLWALARRHWVALLGLVAVSGLVVAVNPQKVTEALAAADPRSLVLMLPCVLLLYLLHGLAWWVALRGAGAQVNLPEAIRVAWISQTFVFLPGGDLWRVPIVRSDGRLQPGVLVGTVVFDDLVYFYVLSTAMLPAALAAHPLAIALAVALLPQSAIFLILLWPAGYSWLASRVAGIPLLRRFAPQLDLLGPTFRRLFTARILIPVLATDAACAVLAIGLFWLSLRAVHAQTALGQVAFTYSAGQVASGLTVLPGALGAYEGMMTGLLAVQGVPPAVAAASALLYRSYNDGLMALLGLALAVLTAPRRPAAVRALEAAPWAMLGLGRAGCGDASGPLRLWAAWEMLMLRVHPLCPAAPGALLRYRLLAHRGREVRLRDGTRIVAGDRILELHLDNRRLTAMRGENGYSTWRAVRRLREDLAALGRQVAAGELGPVVAARAVSLLGRAGAVLGLEVRPRPHTVRAALERYFMAGLDAIYHPDGVRHLRGRARDRWPVETWISASALMERPAPPNSPPGSSPPAPVAQERRRA